MGPAAASRRGSVRGRSGESQNTGYAQGWAGWEDLFCFGYLCLLGSPRYLQGAEPPGTLLAPAPLAPVHLPAPWGIFHAPLASRTASVPMARGAGGQLDPCLGRNTAPAVPSQALHPDLPGRGCGRIPAVGFLVTSGQRGALLRLFLVHFQHPRKGTWPRHALWLAVCETSCQTGLNPV